MNEINKAMEGQVPVVAEIKIVFHQNGQILLHTSTADKVLLLGLLESAKQMVASKQKSNLVQIPKMEVPADILKGGNNCLK